VTVVSDEADVNRAVAVARQLLDDLGLAGPSTAVAMGIVHQGHVIATECRGAADLETACPADADTLFRIGSITKLFTAIAVMQLVDAGQVELDAPAEDYLTSFVLRRRRGSRAATVRELLLHVGGYGEWRSPRDVFARRIPFAVPEKDPVPSMAAFYRRGLRPDRAAGVQYVYSNHAYAALGQLVADVSGTSYATFIHERILEPLGMHSSSVLRTEDVRRRLATGYVIDDDTAHPVPYEHILIAPAGALHCSLNDMLRFAAWLTSDDDIVLPARTRRDMMSRHWQLDPRLPGAGLAFGVDVRRGRQLAGHGGGWPGFITELQLVPDSSFAVVVLTNKFDLTARYVLDSTMDAYLGRADQEGDGVDTASPGVRPDPSRVVGVYAPGPDLGARVRWWNEHGGHIRIERGNDHLRLVAPRGPYADGVKLQPTTDADLWTGTSIRKGQPVALRVRFDGHSDGRSSGLLGALPSLVAMRRRPAATTWPGTIVRSVIRQVRRLR